MSADRWIRGCVNGDGTIESGSGFTVLRTPPGRYEIRYASPFGGHPAVVVTQNYPGWNDFNVEGGDSRDNTVLIASDANRFKIKTGDGNGNAQDRNFSFIAIGPAD